MSSSGAVTSTCADSVAPPGRRIVTVVLPETTCTFVRIVSGATKKPVPKPPPASTRTTAGIDRLITSSSDSVVVGLGTTAGCSAAAAAAFDAASAAATRAAGSRAVSASGDMGALARCTSARSTTAAAGAGILDGAGAAACCAAASSRVIQNSIARSTAPRTAATTNIGGDLRCGVSIATGVVSTGAGASNAVSNTWPQRQVATAVGTRRAHSGQRGIGSVIGVCRAAPTSGALSHLPADAQVQPENGRPSRVMLFVERDPAAPISRVGRRRGRGGRSATQVHDLDVGREQHAAAARSHRRAEVDVLRVHEEAFVEAADGFGIGAAYQQTRTGHPIGIVAF